MSDYVAALCHMVGTEITPFETLSITAADDEEAVRKANEWQLNTVFPAAIEEETWLQVLRDGRAIYSQKFVRL
jgi:hypothetical protein